MKMWSSLSLLWKKCFEQGWDAYCSGSIPIGAVIVNGSGEILSVGRSMQHEKVSTEKHIREIGGSENLTPKVKENKKDGTGRKWQFWKK